MSFLREGMITKDFILKGKSSFYLFPIRQMEKVEEVVVFVTLTEGDVNLYGSNVDPFPTESSNASVILTGANKRIVFSKEKLSNTLYLSVFGEELSYYTINVLVKRE